jgi:hypothetical protein
VEAMRGAELVNLAVDPGDTHATWAASSWCFTLHWLPAHPIDYLHVDVYCVQRRLRVCKVNSTTNDTHTSGSNAAPYDDNDNNLDNNNDNEIKGTDSSNDGNDGTRSTKMDGGISNDESSTRKEQASYNGSGGSDGNDDDVELMIQYRVRKLRQYSRLLPVNPAGFWPHWLLFTEAPSPPNAQPTKRSFPQWMIWESGLQVSISFYYLCSYNDNGIQMVVMK